MKITELVAAIGDENITLQRLGHGYFQFNESKSDCKVTFSTEKGHGQRMIANELVGMVIWFAQEDLDRATGIIGTSPPALPDYRKTLQDLDGMLEASGFSTHGDMRKLIAKTLGSSDDLVPYAACCNSSDPAVCDCIEKNHIEVKR